ncbi:MAG: M4 family metallopeptidase [Ornithinimicrobium sp.]|uniref:M4 family metallopeptidase n=1 Tax=Ornithinimicrobium sp. TaxID=1977084 RepID=UPI0026DF0FC9|nr:M4 family metallopeptidase [Ornithinimicrobium sp.]MDO5740344.1 M4 family metallopeptidase [Ornithinimicrobium sp.]
MTGNHRCSIVPGYLLRQLAQHEPDLAPAIDFALRDAHVLRTRRELRGTRWPQGRPPTPRPADLAGPPAPGPDDPPLPPGTIHGIVGPPLTKDVSILDQPVVQPGLAPATEVPVDATPQRSLHDAQHGVSLPGVQVRGEGNPPSPDVSVNEAFDGLGATWDVLARVFGRDSLDGHGLPLIASVHYARDYDNAFWDGQQMVFGDGDGIYFAGFTRSVDVIAHELAHGLTQFTAGLTYVGQPGALNESVSDVWGSIVRQWVRGESAEQADWLIGAEVFTDRVHGVALRSMAAPGTAYDDPRLGKDPQPAHLADYVDLPHDADNDNGGVHVNSGIPNKAFHLFATALGGHTWERAGQVWWDTMSTRGLIARDVDFATFAAATLQAATTRYGEDSEVPRALRSAWGGVGIDL